MKRSLALASTTLAGSIAVSAVAAGAVPFLTGKSPKVRAAQRVLDDLLATHGASARPGLLVARSGFGGARRVAWVDLERRAIVVEENLLDLLRDRLGDQRADGLALVLGHELAHVLLHPGWQAGFGSLPARSKAIRELEAEADEVGAFMAFVAGYDTLTLGPDVIDLVYSAYGLDDQLAGYPSRTERRTLAVATSSAARAAAALYAAGVLSSVLGQHDTAVELLAELADRYPGVAMLDAAAVAALQSVQHLDADPRALPIGFEVQSGLGSGAIPKALPPPSRRKQDQLLARAETWLARARLHDGGHPAVILHDAARLLLLDRPKAALARAREARESAIVRHRYDDVRRKRAMAASWLVEGLAHEAAARLPDAREAFEQAHEHGDEGAAYNLARLDGETPPTPRALPQPAGAKDTRFVGDGVLRVGSTVVKWRARDGLPRALEVMSRDRRWRLWSTVAGDGAQTSRGLRKGMSRQDTERRYGPPSRTVSSGRGTFLAFGRRHGLVIHFDRSGRVEGWWHFTGWGEEER